MKKKLIAFIGILFITVALGSLSSRATSFDSFDAKTALGGASLALQRYFEQNPDAAEKLSGLLTPLKENTDAYKKENGTDAPEEDEEVLYENRIIGVVAVPSALNVRADATILSEIVAKEYRGMEIYVIGEKNSGSALWYKVIKGETQGYILGKYVVFDQEAEDFKQMVHEEYRDNTELPAEVTFADDINSLPQDVKDLLQGYSAEIKYALHADFDLNKENGSMLGMYSDLIYALENYNYITDIIDQYNLSESASLINNQVWAVELNRERLSHETNTSYEEFQKQMEEEAARKAEEARKAAEEKERREREEAEAAERAYKASMVYQIPNYAASFIGITPYVWGGASLQYGADCSGFVGQVYAHFGLISQSAANSHAYDSYALRSVGRAVSLAEIQPGDLICYNGHVAIYYGNGVIVHAPSPGHYVSFGTLDTSRVIGVRRLY